MSLLTTQAAHREYANRPPDERFPSVATLVEAAQHDRETSVERTYNLRDLTVLPAGDSVELRSPRGGAQFSHWAFGQFSRLVDAPASYLRTLSPQLTADCLNYGISQAPVGTSASLLVRANGGNPMVRAATSDSYARVWDAELYSAIDTQIVQRDAAWTLPPTWTGEPAGAYRGDRDSFLIIVNGGSIVTDPSRRSGGDGAMYRGLLVRNSEVGASSITLEAILFRYVCGNHLLWGAVADRQFRRRHVGTRVVRDALREVRQFAWSYVQQSTERDHAIIRGLIDREIASTREAVIDELRALGATQAQAIAAYERCEADEAVSPRSYWGLTQGLTREAQREAWQDERFQLDQLAAKVLARGARLVAA